MQIVLGVMGSIDSHVMTQTSSFCDEWQKYTGMVKLPCIYFIILELSRVFMLFLPWDGFWQTENPVEINEKLIFGKHVGFFLFFVMPMHFSQS